jgi:hypothetical protein
VLHCVSLILHCGCVSSEDLHMASFATAWLLGVAFALLHITAECSIDYNPGSWNVTCRYHVYDVASSALFNNSPATDQIFPLDRTKWLSLHGAEWWQSCTNNSNPSGSSQQTSSITSSTGLPCGYDWNSKGNVDYWEEQGCDNLHMNNCYCYAVGKERDAGYCEPGLGGSGDRNAWAGRLTQCSAIVAAVVDDGGKVASRDDVYNKPPSGTHYIALSVEPADTPTDLADYHFWRRDSNGFWSSKPGVTLARDFYHNQTLITDVESWYTRGKYTDFCGYFDVDLNTHKLGSTGYTWSIIPNRFSNWLQAGFSTSVEPLTAGWSKEWQALYTGVYFDAGYVEGIHDTPESGTLARESGAAAPKGEQGQDAHLSPSSSMTPLTFTADHSKPGVAVANKTGKAGPRRVLRRSLLRV